MASKIFTSLHQDSWVFICRVTSKVLGISVEERSLGDLNTINSGKYLISAVLYQKNIVLFIHPPVFNQL